MNFRNPKETANEVANIGGEKAKQTIWKLILLGFLAGVYISFGAMLSEIVTSGITVPIGIKRLIFGSTFPLGLILTVICGAELFTGTCLYMPMANLEGKSKITPMIKTIIGSWIFNFIGAIFTVYIIAYLSGIMTVEPFSSTAIGIANAKIANTSWLQLIIRGIGCNWLVCLALYIATSSKDIISKIIGIWFPVMAFVTLGFEHSIANMFFIPLGILLGAPITIHQLFMNNLIPVTIGNLIGGILFVAIIYWYTYLKD